MKGHKVQLVSESDKAEESNTKTSQKKDDVDSDSDPFAEVEDVDDVEDIDDSDPFTHKAPTKKVKNSAEKQKNIDTVKKEESEKVNA